MVLTLISTLYFYIATPVAAAQDESVLRSAAATESSVTSSAQSHRQRNYPGARDEDDIKVQEEQRSPTQTLDRRSIEMKVLKTYFKKTDAELVAPGRSDEESHSPSETE